MKIIYANGETMHMEAKLYQWQEECLKRWLANGGRGTVQAVTGSGKTLLALTAAGRLEKTLDKRLSIKVVVPTASLMRQWARAIRDAVSASVLPPGQIGLHGGGHKASSGCLYTIYVINSARYELARQILAELRNDENILLIADECHHYASDQNRLIFEFLPYIKLYEKHYFSLGLSATLPGGEAQRYLLSVLGQKIYSYGMMEAAKARTVCQYDIFHIALSFQKEERNEYSELSDRMALLHERLVRLHPILDKLEHKEHFELLRTLARDKNDPAAGTASLYMNLSYKRKSLVCLAAARIDCVWDLLEHFTLRTLREKILIFGERISQAEELYQLLQRRYPGRVGRYHSKLGRQANTNILERFRTGEIQILITCRAIDEGMDIPDASVGIILSGTSARRQRIQRLGRIIRMAEGKKRATLYYLHITETSEDTCYLPDNGETHIFELEYCPNNGGFLNPPYDQASTRLLKRMRDIGLEEKKLKEAGHCLELGCVRADFSLEMASIDKNIRDAVSVRDRNYWLCMKRLKEYL